jgi:predicted small metal-binding protein
MTGERFTAIVRCGHCNWSARLTGDEGREVGEALMRIAGRHMKDVHPERSNPSITLERVDAPEVV